MTKDAIGMLDTLARNGTKLVFALLLTWGTVATAASVALKDSTFSALPGKKLELRLDFSSAPPTPNAYVIESPPRVVFDMWGVQNQLGQKQLSVNSGWVKTINMAQANDRLRMVVDLDQMTQYSTRTEGNSLYLVFGGGSSQATAAVPRKAPTSSKPQIQGIDFERVDGGIGRVKIDLSDERAGLDVSEEGHNVLLKFSGAVLSNHLHQRLDVRDFATPVQFIDAKKRGSNTDILIKPGSAPYDYRLYQTGSQVIVDFTPQIKKKSKQQQVNKFPYNGERIDLNFQDVGVRSVLQIIAEVAQKNLVVDDSVSGNITLRLKNVPWDQALDIVLKTRGLDKREVGNVLLVAPAAKIAERERIELESQKQVEELAPIVTDFLQVSFRKASEMKERIEEAKLISERGFILADDGTNVLMVRETATQLEQIRDTLERFDVEVNQIMVEARLVVASTNVADELGVRWGYGARRGEFISGGGGNGNAPYFRDDFPATGTGTPLAVDLGVTPQSSFRLGYASSSFLISTEISALNNSGQAEIVSQPKVITTNGKKALIQSGQEIPFQVVEDGEVSIKFKDVVLSLEVTPQITPGDNIAMDLKITQDSLGQTLPNGEVSINKNQLETSVVVLDGDTIVLGGVYRTESTDDVAKTPLLGDLPGIGKLFRQTRKSDTKNELLIFITPRLLRDELTSRN